MPTPEQIIREKIKNFQECTQDARWDDLVDTCYSESASLSHFVASGPIEGRGAIKSFFSENPSGYQLTLQYTIVKLSASAHLIAGVGSVNKGAWCPFIERWELNSDGEWLIVNDKVFPPESWTK